MSISDRLRRLDERAFPRKRKDGEPPEDFLRRAAVSPLRKAPSLLEVQGALREHFALLDAERRQGWRQLPSEPEGRVWGVQ